MRSHRPVVALILSIALVLGLAGPAFADDLQARVNAVRKNDLSLSAAADRAAQRSAASQAASGVLAHTDLSPLLSTCTEAGEIVGFGPTVDAIFAAFRNSPHHWELITSSDWTSMGTGIATGSDGTLYISIVFCQATANAAPPDSTPPAAPLMMPTQAAPSPAPPHEALAPCSLVQDLVLHEPPWDTGACPGLV